MGSSDRVGIKLCLLVLRSWLGSVPTHTVMTGVYPLKRVPLLLANLSLCCFPPGPTIHRVSTSNE